MGAKTILVTGATGFIGRHVIRALVQQGHKVTATGRDVQRGAALNVPFIPCDLHAPGIDYRELFGVPDVLVHLAWPDTSYLKHPDHLDVYLPADKSFLEQMVRLGVRQVIVSGTCFEYGLQEGCLAETLHPAPVTAYGDAKNKLRGFLEGLQEQKDFILQWVRLFYLYGEGQNQKSLLPQLDRAISAGDPVFNMSGGAQLRDYLAVEEAASFIARLVRHPEITGPVNCGSGKPVSVRAMVEARIAERDSSIQINPGYYPYADSEPMNFWADRKKMMSVLDIKTVCDACGAPDLRIIHRVPRVPAFQHVLFSRREEARATPVVQVDLAACDSCGLVFNAAFDSKAMAYDGDYQNAQDHSPNFRAYLDEIADAVVEGQLPGARYVEIGCGKAFFFNILKERGLNIMGFDPAYEGQDPAIRRAFFTEATGRGIEADTVIMRHTLEHIEKPYLFLKQLKSFLPHKTRLFIEVPRFEWIAEHHAFWDIFHEHCNYFTEKFFDNAFRGRARITPTFDAQYMTIDASIGDLADALPSCETPDFSQLFDAQMAALASAVMQKGRNIVWGAGAKGIAFANLLDPDTRFIESIVDINPRKQGFFVPLSGHPCLAPSDVDWAGLGPEDRLWIMNARYKEEILKSLPPLRCKVIALGDSEHLPA